MVARLATKPTKFVCALTTSVCWCKPHPRFFVAQVPPARLMHASGPPALPKGLRTMRGGGGQLVPSHKPAHRPKQQVLHHATKALHQHMMGNVSRGQRGDPCGVCLGCLGNKNHGCGLHWHKLARAQTNFVKFVAKRAVSATIAKNLLFGSNCLPH